MFNFFKREEKNLPDFWKSYEAKLEKKIPELVHENTFVVFDTETTGFDYKNDRILSIGAVKVFSNSIDVSNIFEHYVHQEIFNPDAVEIHGILRNEKQEKLSEEEALKLFLGYIENNILVAHHAGFDIRMINAALRRMGLPRLKNKVLDTGYLYKKTLLHSNLIDREKSYTLDEIAEAFMIDVEDRHTATGDAYITAIAFLKIMGRLDKHKTMRLSDLLKL